MEKGRTVLAFDLGASSGRAVIGELQGEGGSAALSVTEIHRFENVPVQMGERLYWDFPRLLQELKIGFRKAFQSGFRPESFGIDTWGVDFGLLDRNGELLGNPYHYRDNQTDGLIEELCGTYGKERLFAESGLQFMPFNTIYQLHAMKKAGSPKLDQAETLLLMPDLLLYFLTGVKICEFTNATTTQLIHPHTQTWNRELMSELGLPPGMFLEPTHAGTIVGRLTDDVCKELDVPSVEAVAVGTHDTASAVAAVPASGTSFAYLSCGTWSLLGTELAQPTLSAEALACNFTNEGGVGRTYRLLKNIMGLWLLQECKREWDAKGKGHSFPELVRMAAEAPAFRSFIDPDDLRFLHPSGMPDKIRGYCRETGQPVPETEGAIVRCILESLALCYRQTLESVERVSGSTFGGLHMVGGGIQNELLCRFTANALGKPVWAGPVEGSAIGNMLVQLMALGAFRDMAEARACVRNSFALTTYEPEETDRWQAAYTEYRRIVSA